MKNFLKWQIYVVTYENIHVHTKYTLKLTKGHGMRPASKQTRKNLCLCACMRACARGWVRLHAWTERMKTKTGKMLNMGESE